MKRVAIETHGCKLNQADSQVLIRRFLRAGFQLVDPGDEADVYVVNTCTVTHVADRKARGALRSARRRNPDAVIVATGCYAERVPEDLRRLDEIDLVLGNQEKGNLVQHVADAEFLAVVDDPGESAAYMGPGLRTRAMVKIQEGCNQVCAYCIVPRVRGRERSIPPNDLVAQVSAHVAAGCMEVVLTGTQLGSYGFDLPDSNLAGLIRTLLQETAVERLRVSSLQPQEITDELLQLWRDPRLCPHFHVPLQSGSDEILRRMRRRYTAAQFSESVDRVRRNVESVAITSDLIVGFPGECEDDFEATYSLCDEIRFADLHIFPYSTRPGTSAAHFPRHIDGVTKRRRLHKLLDLAGSHSDAFRHEQVKSVRPVLWERMQGSGESAVWTGLTDNYVRVALRSPLSLGNRVTSLRLERVNNDLVWGSLV